MRSLLITSLCLVAGCSQQSPTPPAEPASSDDAATVAAGPAASPANVAGRADTATDAKAPGRQYRYTSLKDCRTVRDQRTEMPLIETECGGPGPFMVRISDSDARQRMTLITPQGAPYAIPVDRIGGGGFSNFGDTAEWRGPAGDGFRPDALIVRYRVAEQPYPAPETAYLLVVRLAPSPCLVARVAPGPRQNQQARAAADSSPSCLPREATP